MRFIWALLLTICCWSTTCTVRAEPTHYKVHAQAVTSQPGVRFYTDLLELILNASRKPNEVIEFEYSDRQLSQARWIAEVQHSGQNEVAWTITNKEREQMLRPIRVPIVKDLLGMRVLVIRKEDDAKFAAIATADELKKLVAGQGIGWPDTQILQYNGFPVVLGKDKETLYQMLLAKRFDYFPRGVSELAADDEWLKKNGLVVAPNWMLVYPNPMYFFVARDNDELAERLERGWSIILRNGVFEKYFRGQPRIKRAFDELRQPRAQILQLVNPGLPEETPLNDKRFTTDIKEIQRAAKN